MENREENHENRPTLDEIVDFIQGWKEKPENPFLKENQITTKVLIEKTGKSYSWAKNILKEMFDAGLCERERVFLRDGFIFVYTFEELPEVLISV